MRLCAIDRAVLAAHVAGQGWRSVRGIRSHRRLLRVLQRARWRLDTESPTTNAPPSGGVFVHASGWL
jgi:hypothetical protein